MTAQPKPILIKKYANRRLYDTERSTYITLNDLKELIHENRDFVVKDAKSGEDITHSVLAQIIAEEESKGNGESLLPANFLKHLIKFYGENLGRVMPAYLDQTMSHFAEHHKNISKNMTENFDNMFGIDHMEELAQNNMKLMQQAFQAFNPFPANGNPEMEKLKAENERLKAELEELKQKHG